MSSDAVICQADGAPEHVPARALSAGLRSDDGLGHLPVLDGLRGVAILLVLFFHFVYNPHLGAGRGVVERALNAASFLGWTGVDLFFVLSGFLITRILLSTRESPQYFKSFYARRALRIFPLYFGTLVVVFLLHPLFSASAAQRVAAEGGDQIYLWTYTYNLVRAWRPGEMGICNLGHFWSLCIEEQFYLVWPLLLFILPTRMMFRACVALVAGALCVRVLMRLTGFDSIQVFFFTPCRIDALAIGGAIAVLQVVGPPARAWWLRLSFRSGLLLAAAALIAYIASAGIDHGSIRGGMASQSIGFSALALFWAGLLVASLSAPAGSRWRRCLSHPALRTFGKYGYGLYVLHVFVLVGVKGWVWSMVWPCFSWLGSFSTPAAVIGTALILAAISLGMACVCYEFYEKPFLRLKSRFPYSRTEKREQSVEPSLSLAASSPCP